MVKIKDMVPKDTSKGASVKLMLEELQTLNKIAVIKEDDFVIRSLLRGISRAKIIKELNERHKDQNITVAHINDFIELNRDVLYIVKEETEKKYIRRLLQSKTGLSNSLTDLAIKAKMLADKYDEEGDNSNAIAAIRTAADVFSKAGKIEGHYNDGPEVNINMQMDKVVTAATEGESDFKKEILKLFDVEDKSKNKVIDIETKDE